MVMMSQFVESFYGRFFWVGEKSMTINLRNLSMVYLDYYSMLQKPIVNFNFAELQLKEVHTLG